MCVRCPVDKGLVVGSGVCVCELAVESERVGGGVCVCVCRRSSMCVRELVGELVVDCVCVCVGGGECV